MSAAVVGIIITIIIAISAGSFAIAKANRYYFEGMMSIAMPILLILGSVFLGVFLGGLNAEASKMADTLSLYIVPSAFLLYIIIVSCQVFNVG